MFLIYRKSYFDCEVAFNIISILKRYRPSMQNSYIKWQYLRDFQKTR